jgi:hypothetical protein
VARRSSLTVVITCVAIEEVAPDLEGLPDDAVLREVHDREILKSLVTANAWRCERTYGIARSVAGNNVDVKVHNVACFVCLHVALVVLELVASAEEGVAVVVGVSDLHGVLDRPSLVCNVSDTYPGALRITELSTRLELLGHGSTAYGLMC